MDVWFLFLLSTAYISRFLSLWNEKYCTIFLHILRRCHINHSWQYLGYLIKQNVFKVCFGSISHLLGCLIHYVFFDLCSSLSSASFFPLWDFATQRDVFQEYIAPQAALLLSTLITLTILSQAYETEVTFQDHMFQGMKQQSLVRAETISGKISRYRKLLSNYYNNCWMIFQTQFCDLSLSTTRICCSSSSNVI